MHPGGCGAAATNPCRKVDFMGIMREGTKKKRKAFGFPLEDVCLSVGLA